MKLRLLAFGLCLLTVGVSAYGVAPHSTEEWTNPLMLKGKLDSPLVEVTPFVFQDKLYRLENWQKQWEFPGSDDGSRFTEDEVRIRDMETDQIVSVPFTGHGLGMAFVNGDRVHVFAGNWGAEKKWNITEIEMVSSTDLVQWSAPIVVLRAEPHEKFFNVSVCKGPDDFVLLVESNDPAWPAFTFKYFRSDDLVHWRPVPDGLYGREKYVGGPALYHEGDFFYTLYLQSLGEGKYETRVTRSRDLVHWQDAPEGRPFVTFNPENGVHPLRPAQIRESNASDAELCAWQGKTVVYYTGGDQHLAGDLQWAEFDGTPRKLLERFYEDSPMTTPSPVQQRYQENQLGCFVHFGPASFIGGSDYLTAPDASVFNPVDLDAEQWVLAAKSIGAKHIILTAKHHNGFCLWPTDTTDYSVRSAPWKNGQGDVVAEFVAAARKHGISPGLYISAGDTHAGCKSTPEPRGVRKIIGDPEAYFPVYMQQLTELLTHYGDLEIMWFDGAYNPFDPDVLDATGTPVGGRYADVITETVRRLQPNAAIMGGARSDVRWAGSEQGLAPYPLWNVIELGEGTENWLPESAEGWHIPESNVHTRKHWFWSPDSDSTLKTPEQMLDIYYGAIGGGANLLVNLTPDTRGLVPDAEVAMLRGLGDAVKARFTTPLAQVQGEGNWEEGQALRLTFDKPTHIENVVIEEDLRFGQRIKTYCVEAQLDGHWKPVATGESIGRKRIHKLDSVTTQALRLRILDCVPLPHVRNFAAFAPPQP
ncbi:MAG: alpha-L-fucosidase [Candidatus Hydrogenedentes bacterium]|nr:alpha-L-fucosidase [Candidatus Hydrogenedentota bacterium]